MNKRKALLTFEWDAKNEVLEVHANNEGLEQLSNIINCLVKKNGNDHVHLMTNLWGGDELSDKKQSFENELVNHVKIFKWADERQ